MSLVDTWLALNFPKAGFNEALLAKACEERNKVYAEDCKLCKTYWLGCEPDLVSAELDNRPLRKCELIDSV